jgi:hypothetical protein
MTTRYPPGGKGRPATNTQVTNKAVGRGVFYAVHVESDTQRAMKGINFSQKFLYTLGAVHDYEE